MVGGGRLDEIQGPALTARDFPRFSVTNILINCIQNNNNHPFESD